MLSRVERALERVVEEGLAGVFRLRVQPAEIGRRLERAMLDGRAPSVGATLGPNAFAVRLHPDDATAYADWEDALCRELEGWLAELAYARGIVTVGPIRVRLDVDPSVPRRSVRVAARFDDAEHAKPATRPAGRTPLAAISLVPRRGRQCASFNVARSATVGRAADNDLIIPDPDVSRHHARLELERDTWRVTDLESTNGTWLNGEQIGSARFDVGDELAFAGVSFTVVAG
jgi:hypothetical protein